MNISESEFRNLTRLFWDKPLQKNDLHEYPVWVIKRVLEYGDIADIHCIVKFYGKESFLRKVADMRFFSKRTENFWRQILAAENIPCTTTSSHQGQ